MKGYRLYLGSLALVLASCETGEITTGGDFDPLTAPGSGRTAVAANRGFKAGSFVRSSMDNAAFFSKKPKGDAQADKTLPANTSMKVISDDGNYVKVELDSGDVGYVLSVMVTDGSGNPASDPAGLSPDAIQVYPPLPGGTGPALPDPNVPTIPSVIDPEAPVIPDSTPIPEPPPLPPGNEAEGLPPEKSAESLPPVEGGNP